MPKSFRFVEVRLLGALEVRAADGQLIAITSHRQQALLALLSLRPSVVTPVDRLIEEMWGDSAPQQPTDTALRLLAPHRAGARGRRASPCRWPTASPHGSR